MKRKIFSFILVFSILLGCNSNVFALSEEVDDPQFGSIEDNYTFYTLDFSDTSSEDIQLSSFQTLQVDNKEKIVAAIDYVLSLDLADKGYGYIEESCLSELYDMMDDEDNYILNSYSVLIPKSRLSMEYYGTKEGLRFFYSFYSSMNKYFFEEISDSQKQLESSKIKHFINSAIDIVACFFQAEITVPYTLVKSAMNLPQKYTIKEGAFMLSAIEADILSRGIYLEGSGNSNTWELCHSDEKTGSIRPFIVFFPADNTLDTSINLELTPHLPTFPPVYSPNYNAKDYVLNRAWRHVEYNASIIKDVINGNAEFPSSHTWT